jgi:hypothetical protein
MKILPHKEKMYFQFNLINSILQILNPNPLTLRFNQKFKPKEQTKL